MIYLVFYINRFILHTFHCSVCFIIQCSLFFILCTLLQIQGRSISGSMALPRGVRSTVKFILMPTRVRIASECH